MGRITQEQYDWVKGQAGDPVDRLVEDGLVNERDAKHVRAQSKANAEGFAYADLDRIRVDLGATLSLPSDLARELGALPLKLDGKTLWIAMLDPRDRRAVARAEEASGCRVIPVSADPDGILAALSRL